MSTLAPLPQLHIRRGEGADGVRELVGILQDQQSAKLDLVYPTNKIRLSGGALVIEGEQVLLTEDGVSDPNGVYGTMPIVDQNIADLFGIPVRYVRRMRAEKVSLLDTNVNEWAADAQGSSLIRLIQGTNPDDPTSSGLVRAILSSKYGIRDHLDTVISVLQGLRAAGLDASNINGIDLSDERLYLSVDVPEIAIEAKELIAGYHFYSREARDFPLMNAGLVFTNSEVGRGAFEILPRATVQICRNGLTRKVDGFRKVHLGGRLQEGQINWSTETVEAANKFVQAQVQDAVASFLSEGYLTKLRDDLIKDSGVEVKDVNATIEAVAKKMQYTATEADDILNAFIDGGLRTSGGVMHAVTAVAQKIEDADRAFEFNNTGIEAMQAAARISVNA
jgi:hypothetical protein